MGAPSDKGQPTWGRALRTKGTQCGVPQRTKGDPGVGTKKGRVFFVTLSVPLWQLFDVLCMHKQRI